MCADAMQFIYFVKQKRTVTLVSIDKNTSITIGVGNNIDFFVFRAGRSPSEVDAFWMTCDVQSCMKQKNSIFPFFLGLASSNNQFVQNDLSDVRE